MTTRLYLIPLPDSDAQSTSDQISSQVQQTGLLTGGTATERIATENVDLSVSGQFRAGSLLNRKLSKELESMGESQYSAVPLWDTGGALGRKRGYYEVERVDVNPAHPVTEHVFEYEVGLSHTGTRKSHWRAVTTTSETITTNFATGSAGLIGIPHTAERVQWYDKAQGREQASRVNRVQSEFGRVDQYDPTNSTFSDPTLIYGVPHGDVGPKDVRVWDTRGMDKYTDTTNTGGFQYDQQQYDATAYSETQNQAITQWTHAYHAGFEFDGLPLVDNGLLRITFDEPNGVIDVQEWSDGWSDVTINHGDLSLVDVDIERVSPTMTEVYTAWEDSGGTESEAIVGVQRGLRDAVIRESDNGTLTTALENVLAPIASDQTTDQRPSQTVRAKSEVK